MSAGRLLPIPCCHQHHHCLPLCAALAKECLIRVQVESMLHWKKTVLVLLQFGLETGCDRKEESQGGASFPYLPLSPFCSNIKMFCTLHIIASSDTFIICQTRNTQKTNSYMNMEGISIYRLCFVYTWISEFPEYYPHSCTQPMLTEFPVHAWPLWDATTMTEMWPLASEHAQYTRGCRWGTDRGLKSWKILV